MPRWLASRSQPRDAGTFALFAACALVTIAMFTVALVVPIITSGVMVGRLLMIMFLLPWGLLTLSLPLVIRILTKTAAGFPAAVDQSMS